MKGVYFFRPIWRMFDFKGTTGRTEYFTYEVMSFPGRIVHGPLFDLRCRAA